MQAFLVVSQFHESKQNVVLGTVGGSTPATCDKAYVLAAKGDQQLDMMTRDAGC